MIGFVVILALCLAVIVYLVGIYNGLVGLRENVKVAWANIDVLLKQRHDELPKLVETCKRYMQFEQDTLQKVMRARASVSQASSTGNVAAVGAAEEQLRAGVGRLFAVAENYPQLKTDETFKLLQGRITALEESIADRRELYNDQVNLNNIASAEPFLLDDGTGQCLIDPSGAEVFPSVSNVWYGPDAWPQVCIPNGSGVWGWLADTFITDRYRYSEHRLMEREQVYAIGAFHSLGGVPVDSPDGAVSELLRQWKLDQPRLLTRFDSNHDGTLSSAEWELARDTARQQVLRARTAEIRSPSFNVLSEPVDGRAFLLAASDGESLARRFRRSALAGIGGFLSSSVALTWILTHVW